MKKKILAFTLLSVLTISSLAGCSDKKKTTVTTNQDAVVTQAPKKPLGPGEEFKANMGEEFKYEKKQMDIKFIEIAQTSAPAADGTVCYAFVFSATNNGKEDINIWMLDDFKIKIDEKDVDREEMYSAISAASGAIAYPDYNRYDSTVKAGESIEGIVPFELKEDWKTMVVEYKPDSSNSNDYIVYEVSKSDVVEKFEQ